MTDLIPREHYLNLLRKSKDVPFIKVITGMRRCGKSTLLAMFRDELIFEGISSDDIYFRSFNDETDDEIVSQRILIDEVKSKLTPGKGKYIFLDEIQNVTDWERAVSSFYERGADVYITGSNSKMLSSDIATLLSGRSVEINVYPLSFTEFLQFREKYGKEATLEDKFKEYLERGSLPATVQMSGMDDKLVSSATTGTYNTAFLKDVVRRNEIRNVKMISHISAFLMKNIGNRTSISNVSGYLASRNMKASPDTIESYIGYLEDAKLFERAKRFDSKTKDYLMTLNKFYVADLGIRNSVIGAQGRDMNGVLENVVYNELIYRNGNASVVSVEGREVDFRTKKNDGTYEYYQVATSIYDEHTKDRELSSLLKIDDNYPKYIITVERYPFNDIEGVKILNILDFLINEK